MAQVFDVRSVSFITVGTIGIPGQRVFYLQAGSSARVVTLTIEKQHAVALASGLDDLLLDIAGRFPRPDAEAMQVDMALRQPVEPLFRVGQMGLAYDEETDRVVLIAYQFSPDDDADSASVRFWGTREQMRALRDQALVAIEGGRPTCEFCGELIEPDGHLCPRRNGHGNHPTFTYQ